MLDIGMVQDLFGPFSIFALSSQELLWRVEHSWHLCVCHEVKHRKGLHDLHLASPSLTRRWFETLTAVDQGIARKILNGAHFTNDGKKFCNETDNDACPWCDSSGRFHRFWQCERLHFALDSLSSDVAKLIPSPLKA